jgi:adenosylcobinamide amidohydrolase
LIRSELHSRLENGAPFPIRLWRFARPLTVASTAAAGGGVGRRRWIVNAQVPSDYTRRDPERHVLELARNLGVEGEGVGMLTAADVTHPERTEDGGVSVEITVGISHPTWAAAAEGPLTAAPGPGTINVVAFIPEPLRLAALLNTLCTVTEAKSQALLLAGIPGTGTASDAVTVACPVGAQTESFGGTRSRFGGRLARAVCAAVLAGCSAAPVPGGNR